MECAVQRTDNIFEAAVFVLHVMSLRYIRT